MVINHIEFTDDEIEEVELARDLCDGVLVEGERVICFEVLTQLFIHKILVKENKDDLIRAYLQLVQYNKFWSTTDWFNNKHIEIVTNKLRRLIRTDN